MCHKIPPSATVTCIYGKNLVPDGLNCRKSTNEQIVLFNREEQILQVLQNVFVKISCLERITIVKNIIFTTLDLKNEVLSEKSLQRDNYSNEAFFFFFSTADQNKLLTFSR